MGHAPSRRGPLSLPKDRSCMPGPRGFPAVVCGPEPVTGPRSRPWVPTDLPPRLAWAFGGAVGSPQRPAHPQRPPASLSSLVLPKDGREGRS